MSPKYYMDEQYPDAVTDGLRARGVDVLRVQDDGRRRTDDELILDRALELERVVVTHDDDFLAIAVARQRAGVEFAGVIYGHQLAASVGKFIADLELIAKATTAEELRNTITYLPIH